MSIYRPTWLYIKQHNQTGLKYFGKTTAQNPFTYFGSGTYWKKHLKVHGKDVSTLWVQQFVNEADLVQFAINFSKENNIVESKEWANLIIENGLDGAAPGIILTESHKTKLRNQSRAKISATGEVIPGKVSSDDPRWATGEIIHPSNGEIKTEEYKNKRKGFRQTDAGILRISAAQTGHKNNSFGTTIMVNHTTYQKIRLKLDKVPTLELLGWVRGNKHAYTAVKWDQIFSS